jgi:hypothetical protein
MEVKFLFKLFFQTRNNVIEKSLGSVEYVPLSATDLGRQVIWHNAGIDGYSAIIGFNPAKQIGLAILCSCFFTDVPPSEMIDVAMTFLLYH